MIEIKSLMVAYNNESVINDLNLTLEAGKLNVIIGKNGSGKTTLLKAICNQITYTGEVLIDGLNVKDLNNKKRAHYVSYLPQFTNNANISVKKLVQHGRYRYTSHNRKLTPADNKAIDEALLITDTKKIASKYLTELSGGERQRAYLAMVLSQDSKVTILDEPCNFLDIDHQISILNLIKDLKKLNKTIIVVLHNLEQAFTIADNIILLDEGKVILSGSPSYVSSSNELKDIFNVCVAEQKDGLYDYYLRSTCD